MVDHLSTKLATFRRVWNAKAAEINMGELLNERLGYMTKKHDADAYDYDAAPDTTTEQDTITTGTLEGEPTPGPLDEAEAPPKEYMLVAFDLSVWQRHDVEGKLQSFGGHGIKEVDASLLPPDEETPPPDEEIIEEKTA